ncbi:MAG: hypothetical protein KC478_16950, partial [Bacteriovoracaceae bacterium]|nr:hypothetical protein [Bacteriovoracaceae bacterium]
VVILPIKEFSSIIVDGSSCIDLVPTLMVLMGLSGKEQKITNIKNLRYKECDRLEQMQRILSHFEVPFSYDENSDVFTIQGIIPKTKYIKIETAHDHRMVMCAAMMVKMFGGGEVAPVEACAKSFGNFFEYFR